MCAGHTTRVQEKSESDLVAVMINGRNFQCSFHSDNGSKSKKKKAILLVALFSTIDPKGGKKKKKRNVESPLHFFSYSIKAQTFSKGSSHSHIHMSSWVLERINQPSTETKLQQQLLYSSLIDLGIQHLAFPHFSLSN